MFAAYVTDTAVLVNANLHKHSANRRFLVSGTVQATVRNSGNLAGGRWDATLYPLAIAK